MTIIAADDEPFALENLARAIKTAEPEAELITFTEPEEAVEYGRQHVCDAAFLDIEMGTMSGIEAARQLKLSHPKINIIFVTGYSQYMKEAIQLRMSGYVNKPVTVEDIREELDNLRHPVAVQSQKLLTVRCFGNFDVFLEDGRRLDFERRKTKELLAYLVDRHGSAVTSGELRSILWRDAATDENTRAYLSKLRKDLKETLARAGAADVLIVSWGKYAVDTSKISCDYYDFLENKPEGIRAFNGEYMSQFSWGESKKFDI